MLLGGAATREVPPQERGLRRWISMDDDDEDSLDEPKGPGRGRKSKMTADVVANILNGIRAGNYPRVAAQLSGIAASVHNKWMARGDKGAVGDEMYVEYRDAVMRAEAELHSKVAQIAMKHIGQNGKDALAFLERRFPDEWAKREKHDHSGTVDHRVGVVMMPPIEQLPVQAAVQVIATNAAKQLTGGTSGESEGSLEPIARPSDEVPE